MYFFLMTLAYKSVFLCVGLYLVFNDSPPTTPYICVYIYDIYTHTSIYELYLTYIYIYIYIHTIAIFYNIRLYILSNTFNISVSYRCNRSIYSICRYTYSPHYMFVNSLHIYIISVQNKHFHSYRTGENNLGQVDYGLSLSVDKWTFSTEKQVFHDFICFPL